MFIAPFLALPRRCCTMTSTGLAWARDTSLAMARTATSASPSSGATAQTSSIALCAAAVG